jgi:hypothetical protein
MGVGMYVYIRKYGISLPGGGGDIGQENHSGKKGADKSEFKCKINAKKGQIIKSNRVCKE